MIAHFDLDAFFASCEIRDNPKLVNKPVVVAFVTPNGSYCNRGVVSAASYKVREYGVHSGMSLWEAKKRCPNLIIISGNFAKYHESSQKMYQIFRRFSPSVEPLSLDEAFLDFAGCESIYPDLLKTCTQIKSEIKSEIGITCSCGLAFCKVVAKMASGFNKPDGLTYVAYGTEAEFLAPLSVRKLYGVGYSLGNIFTKIGVETIGDLAFLPYDFMESAFGKYGETVWHWANGRDDRKVVSTNEIKSIGRSTTFIKDSKDLKFIKTNLYYLSEKIAAALRQTKITGRRLTVSIRYFDFKTQSHQRLFKNRLGSAKEIYKDSEKLVLECWDKKTALRLVGVSISDFENNGEQLSFFENPTRQRILENSLDKLRRKYGFWVVRPASLANLKIVKKHPEEEQLII